jgi:hypothetical protein
LYNFRRRGHGVVLVTGTLRRAKASEHRYLLMPFRAERLLAPASDLVAEVKDCVPATRRAGG